MPLSTRASSSLSSSSSSLLIWTSAALAAAVTVYLVSAQVSIKRKEKKQATDKDSNGSRQEEEEEEADDFRIPIREIGVNVNGNGNGNDAISSKQPAVQDKDQQQEQFTATRRILTRGSITIVHGSTTGTCAKFAASLATRMIAAATADLPTSCSSSSSSSKSSQIQVASTRDFDWWDELINDDGDIVSDEATSIITSKSETEGPELPPALLVVLLSTYSQGSWPPVAESLLTALQDLLSDWRIAKFPLKGKLRVAVFGTASSEYDASTMGKPAKECKQFFQRLGAKCLVPLHVGDDYAVMANNNTHAQETFDKWQELLLSRAGLVVASGIPGINNDNTNNRQNMKNDQNSCCKEKSSSNSSTNGTNGDSCCQASNSNKDADANVDDNYESDDDEDDDDDNREPEVVDLEDMGDSILAASNPEDSSSSPREMVTPSQAAALKKEGYRLIGSHSAVKLCRWTKHQLRGRGGCYKHTFYGITSYQCMEATPSLACANKCVFCWRHHKNPVGKEWRWKTDDPHYIVEQAIQIHVQMIKEAKGIPGVQMDRWKEAHTVRHCALSLVGEPIMYPRIDELLQDLHSRKISSFLVTNGQHPQAIANLRPVTQLYVSVDAPTKESLIAIDRPLFQDAWDRLKQSLVFLKDRPHQRTVARLTVVKGWNSDEIEGYAQLIALGRVSLVEVKGVTFCGKSDASNLNMTNTPWHHEVVELTQTLKKEIDKMRARKQGGGANDDIPPEYGLACEHKHSCSVLLARVDQFAVDDPTTGSRRWRTWIDYDTFHELASRHASDSSFTYTVQDYTAETPTWALFGSEEEGFDPTDTRHRKKTKHPKYVQFDESGIPTHDQNNIQLGESERDRLRILMEERKRQIGAGGSVVTEVKDGAREVLDASLMFRGLVVAK